MRRFALLLLPLLVLVSLGQGLAWYNDSGNDSCLVAYADQEIYYLSPGQDQFGVVYKVENNCGKSLTTNAGTYFSDQIKDGVDIQSIQYADKDHWVSISQTGLASIQEFKPGYSIKGQTEIVIPEGETLIRIIYKIPRTGEKQEFALAMQDTLDDSIKTTLDPWFDEIMPVDYNTQFYEPFNPGNIDANWTGDTGNWDDASGYAEETGGSSQGIYIATAYTLTDFNYYNKFAFNNAGDFVRQWVCAQSAAVDPNDGYLIEYEDSATNTIKVVDDSDANVIITATLNLNEDTWYDLNLDRAKNGMMFLYVNGALQGTPAANMNYTTCAYTSIMAEASGIWARRDEITIFNNESAGKEGDVNAASVDDYDFNLPLPTFASTFDGNLSLDFNVFHNTNDRLTIDIRYSASSTEDTGTLIVDDLNLTTAVCSSEDWDVQRSACTWDWNIETIPDSNYFILFKITDESTNTNFEAGANPVQVQNDLNLLILQPINEATGAPIDTNVYSYNVRIKDDSQTTTTTGLIAAETFGVPYNTTDFVTVEVDTNVSADFYSRVVSYKFTSKQGQERWQPYLAPVSDSILTTVHTVSKSGLENITGIRLKVFKTLSTGRTLLHDVITDSKGESAIAFVIADEYEIEVFDVNGGLITTKTYTATATTTDFFIYITSIGEIEIPGLEDLTVTWLPAFDVLEDLTAADTNVSAKIKSFSDNITSTQVYVTNNDVNIFDSGFDTAVPADGNIFSVVLINLPLYDSDFAADFTVIVNITDGNQFIYKKSYVFSDNNMLKWIRVDLREDFGCSTDVSLPCVPIMIIALFITIFAVGGIALGTPIRNGAGLSILALIITSIFVFFGWYPLWMLIPTAIAGFSAIVLTARGAL